MGVGWNVVREILRNHWQERRAAGDFVARYIRPLPHYYSWKTRLRAIKYMQLDAKSPYNRAERTTEVR